MPIKKIEGTVTKVTERMIPTKKGDKKKYWISVAGIFGDFVTLGGWGSSPFKEQEKGTFEYTEEEGTDKEGNPTVYKNLVNLTEEKKEIEKAFDKVIESGKEAIKTLESDGIKIDMLHSVEDALTIIQTPPILTQKEWTTEDIRAIAISMFIQRRREK